MADAAGSAARQQQQQNQQNAPSSPGSRNASSGSKRSSSASDRETEGSVPKYQNAPSLRSAEASPVPASASAETRPTQNQSQSQSSDSSSAVATRSATAVSAPRISNRELTVLLATGKGAVLSVRQVSTLLHERANVMRLKQTPFDFLVSNWAAAPGLALFIESLESGSPSRTESSGTVEDENSRATVARKPVASAHAVRREQEQVVDRLRALCRLPSTKVALGLQHALLRSLTPDDAPDFLSNERLTKEAQAARGFQFFLDEQLALRQLLASVVIASADDANPFRDMCQSVVDAISESAVTTEELLDDTLSAYANLLKTRVPAHLPAAAAVAWSDECVAEQLALLQALFALCFDSVVCPPATYRNLCEVIQDSGFGRKQINGPHFSASGERTMERLTATCGLLLVECMNASHLLENVAAGTPVRYSLESTEIESFFVVDKSSGKEPANAFATVSIVISEWVDSAREREGVASSWYPAAPLFLAWASVWTLLEQDNPDWEANIDEVVEQALPDDAFEPQKYARTAEHLGVFAELENWLSVLSFVSSDTQSEPVQAPLLSLAKQVAVEFLALVEEAFGSSQVLASERAIDVLCAAYTNSPSMVQQFWMESNVEGSGVASRMIRLFNAACARFPAQREPLIQWSSTMARWDANSAKSVSFALAQFHEITVPWCASKDDVTFESQVVFVHAHPVIVAVALVRLIDRIPEMSSASSKQSNSIIQLRKIVDDMRAGTCNLTEFVDTVRCSAADIASLSIYVRRCLRVFERSVDLLNSCGGPIRESTLALAICTSNLSLSGRISVPAGSVLRFIKDIRAVGASTEDEFFWAEKSYWQASQQFDEMQEELHALVIDSRYMHPTLDSTELLVHVAYPPAVSASAPRLGFNCWEDLVALAAERGPSVDPRSNLLLCQMLDAVAFSRPMELVPIESSLRGNFDVLSVLFDLLNDAAAACNADVLERADAQNGLEAMSSIISCIYGFVNALYLNGSGFDRFWDNARRVFLFGIEKFIPDIVAVAQKSYVQFARAIEGTDLHIHSSDLYLGQGSNLTGGTSGILHTVLNGIEKPLGRFPITLCVLKLVKLMLPPISFDEDSSVACSINANRETDARTVRDSRVVGAFVFLRAEVFSGFGTWRYASDSHRSTTQASVFSVFDALLGCTSKTTHDISNVNDAVSSRLRAFFLNKMLSESAYFHPVLRAATAAVQGIRGHPAEPQHADELRGELVDLHGLVVTALRLVLHILKAERQIDIVEQEGVSASRSPSAFDRALSGRASLGLAPVGDYKSGIGAIASYLRLSSRESELPLLTVRILQQLCDLGPGAISGSGTQQELPSLVGHLSKADASALHALLTSREPKLTSESVRCAILSFFSSCLQTQIGLAGMLLNPPDSIIQLLRSLAAAGAEHGRLPLHVEVCLWSFLADLFNMATTFREVLHLVRLSGHSQRGVLKNVRGARAGDEFWETLLQAKRGPVERFVAKMDVEHRDRPLDSKGIRRRIMITRACADAFRILTCEVFSVPRNGRLDKPLEDAIESLLTQRGAEVLKLCITGLQTYLAQADTLLHVLGRDLVVGYTFACDFLRVLFLRQQKVAQRNINTHPEAKYDLLFVLSVNLRTAHRAFCDTQAAGIKQIWESVLQNSCGVALCMIKNDEEQKSSGSRRVLRHLLDSVSSYADSLSSDAESAVSLLQVVLGVCLECLKSLQGEKIFPGSLISTANRLLGDHARSDEKLAMLSSAVLATIYFRSEGGTADSHIHISTTRALVDSLRFGLRKATAPTNMWLLEHVNALTALLSVPRAAAVALESDLVEVCASVSMFLSDSGASTDLTLPVHHSVLLCLSTVVTCLPSAADSQQREAILSILEAFVVQCHSIVEDAVASLIQLVYDQLAAPSGIKLSATQKAKGTAARRASWLVVSTMSHFPDAQAASVHAPRLTALAYRFATSVLPAITDCLVQRRAYQAHTRSDLPGDLDFLTVCVLDLTSACLRACQLLSPPVAMVSRVLQTGESSLSAQDLDAWQGIWSRWNPLFLPPDDTQESHHADDDDNERGPSLWKLWHLQRCCATAFNSSKKDVTLQLFYPGSRPLDVSVTHPSAFRLLTAVLEQLFMVIVPHALFYSWAAKSKRSIVLTTIPATPYPLAEASGHGSAIRRRLAEVAREFDNAKQSSELLRLLMDAFDTNLAHST